MKVTWTDEARRQLQAIVDYIGEDSPSRALEFTLKLESKVIRLVRFPESGRIVPEWQDASVDFREIIIGSYRGIYRAHKQNLEIITVYHAMRRFPPPF